VTVLSEQQGRLRDKRVVVRNLNGKPIGEVVLNGEVWDTPLRADLVHHSVLWQRCDLPTHSPFRLSHPGSDAGRHGWHLALGGRRVDAHAWN
jgi:ribosomal protein L4